MLAELLKKRAAAFDTFKALADKPTLTTEEEAQYEPAMRAVTDLDGQIKRAKEAQALAVETAVPVADQENETQIQVREHDPYTKEEDARAMGLVTNKGLRAIAAVKLFTAGGNTVAGARALSVEMHGERHPITRAFEPRFEIGRGGQRALVTSVGASGGFIVPPDYATEIIELLRPKAVVRAAGPRVIPMPRGTMTLPGQGSAASAGYGPEGGRIKASQQGLNSITASFKKLTALVPVSNDMMRYADPAADAFVRDDLVKVVALTEDYAFILGDGLQDSPRGFLSFANAFATTAGIFSITGNSTASAGGNFITSTANYTLATVAAELGGAVNKLDTANVDADKRVWFMNPRSYNYLYNVQNSLGVYVYRDELNKGTLFNYPVWRTNQIGTNYHNADSSQTDCSFVFLVEMTEDMILDSMSLELAVSREGTYVDAGGNTVSAFQQDQTLIRAITEHDHQMRHDAAVAVIQFVRWAPAIA
jgi:HK97 family phage major capsid protein